jgi:putative pyruvate formate lyase activating enzyme
VVYTPSYINLYKSGSLEKRIEEALQKLSSCNLCPRNCGVNRLKGERGFCRSGEKVVVSSVGPHFGEEPELVGRRGSGTIFLTNCNLRCLYCQNYEISHLGYGKEMDIEAFSDQMLYLQQLGCHNINFVTPTHFVPQIIASLPRAIENGLKIPLVYNCGGYENIETLQILDGVIDIYMPDAKYANGDIADKYSKAPDYPEVVKRALLEMYRQVGDLAIDEEGVAIRGLLIRHLVLPNKLAGTEEIMQFISKELSTNTYVNIMAQYRPMYRAREHQEINRRISELEYMEAIRIAKREGLYRGFGEDGWLY